MERREHWERIYANTPASKVSWYQAEATISLELIRRVAPEPESPIIDVGGGASTLVDQLLDAGYVDLTVLDLSAAALDVAQHRLGARASQVRWVAADVLSTPFVSGGFAVWHDRAVFHFLTEQSDRVLYVARARAAVRPGGYLVVASFAPEGPKRCSGLAVVRYSPDTMQAEFGADFELLDSRRENHRTPSGHSQAFVYCVFRRRGVDT
jgi:SAM-dependent methyltransferase